MTTISVVSQDTLNLLASLTGQPTPDQAVPRSIIFTSAVTTVLLGTILVDASVTSEEMERFRDTINRLTGGCSRTKAFLQVIYQGIKTQQSYRQPQHLALLAQPLSIPERLLLIAFGYEMAAADGTMDDREANYLDRVGQHIGIQLDWINVLKAAFCNTSVPSSEARDAVLQLLDPSRFQGLELSFIDAATYIYDHIQSKLIPSKVVPTSLSVSSINTQYQGFAAFQLARTQLLNIIEQTQSIISEFVEKSFLSQKSLADLSTISSELQSSEFRVAIIGEFSKGKSTLLNALLGEAVQPVRAIPCSGAISMIRYSDSPEIICYYEDGREEPLSQEQYKERVSIPRSEARGDNLSNALLEASQIEKVVFGSPKLELCRQGVVIIDSPGLNEHPKRTEVTQKILNKIDAAIFLSHAQNLLSQSEFQILEDLRKRLNFGDESRPAQALFFVVNFMDLLEDEEDREDAKQRAEKKLLEPVDEKEAILNASNRLHYLSAGKALKAIKSAASDEYLESFNIFVRTLESFLTKESGSIRLAANQTKSQNLYEAVFMDLQTIKESLSGEITSLEENVRQKFLEKIGEVTGRITLFNEQVIQQCNVVISNYRISVEEWSQGLEEYLKDASSNWTSEHSPIWGRDQKIKDYIAQLESDFEEDLESWCEEELVLEIMEPVLDVIDQEFQVLIQEMDESMTRLAEEVQASTSDEKFRLYNLGITDIDREMGAWSVGGAATITVGALLAGAALLLPGLTILTGVISILGGGQFSSGFNMLSQLDEGIREAVLREGFESIKKQLPHLISQLEDTIRDQFHERIEVITKRGEYYIMKLNLDLERDQKIASETAAERQADLVWLEDRKAKLLELQEKLNSFSYQADS